MPASASHPDLLGGWDTWAEAPEGTFLPPLEAGSLQNAHCVWCLSLSHHDLTTTPSQKRSEGQASWQDMVPTRLGAHGRQCVLSAVRTGLSAQVPASPPVACLCGQRCSASRTAYCQHSNP